MNIQRFAGLTILVAVVLVGGCASGEKLDPVALKAADYGTFPTDYENIVKAYYQTRLKDPYSAQYRFTEPYQGYLRATPIVGGKPTKFGYIVEVYVNAKNSFGGYVGEELERLFIRNGVCVGRIYPNAWFSEPWYQE
jgi:hypothetical protein